MLIRTLAAFLIATGVAASAESEAVQNFKKAFSDQDSASKRAAVSALASKAAGEDDEVLPLLLQALGDRQSSDAAVAALRARTGLSPSSKKGSGGYPGYPDGDSVGSWSAWMTARKADKDKDKKLDEALKAADEAKKKAGGEAPKAPGTGEPTDSANNAPGPSEVEVSSDLGKLDRILFKNGSSLVCYIVNKRTDAEGNMISVRVVHQDEGGEETLTAEMIARIEEDVE